MSQLTDDSKTILLVEDDSEITRLLGMFLSSEGFAFHAVDHGDQAVDTVRSVRPDLVILDVMLPGLSGVQICQLIRDFYTGPVLMLTACEDDMTEISALNVGADDYLVKPVRPHVLLARLKALLRRVSPQAKPASPNLCLQCGDLSIDLQTRSVMIAQQSIDLSTAEYELLVYLAGHQGEIVSRDDCFIRLRGIEYDGLDRSMDMRLSSLRKKLNGFSGNTPVIKTIRGRGYLMVCPS